MGKSRQLRKYLLINQNPITLKDSNLILDTPRKASLLLGFYHKVPYLLNTVYLEGIHLINR